MNARRWIIVLAASTVLAVVLAIGVVIGAVVSDDGGTSAPVAETGIGSAQAGATAAEPGSIADLVSQVRKSVVAVGVVTQTLSGQTSGLGSGIVVDADGHILTNYHVVQGATDVSVKLWDGNVLPAHVLGTDPGSDLAVIQVDPQSHALDPAVLGDSEAIRPGDPVFAIGNPFDFEFTVTEGIVSAISRSANSPIGRPVPGVIQTDAAINPGNSGGPLFNLAGEVVGINTALENPTGQSVFVGIGLAIPVNRAQRFLPDMIAGNAIEHPQIGIQGMTLNERAAQQANLSVSEGVYVLAVQPGGAAERAGLHGATDIPTDGSLPLGGEVITALDGQPVTSIEQLVTAIDQHAVGDDVQLTVLDAGTQRTVDVTLLAWQASG